MTFLADLEQYREDALTDIWNKVTDAMVDDSLARPRLTLQDYAILLSPAAGRRLEEMARQSNRLTVQHFGRTIILYTPLYLANFCINHCVYCGFNARNPIPRRQLTFDEVESEAKAIAARAQEN